VNTWQRTGASFKNIQKHLLQQFENINAGKFLLLCLYGTGGDANGRDVIWGGFWLP
jgi:hypothetical protein